MTGPAVRAAGGDAVDGLFRDGEPGDVGGKYGQGPSMAKRMEVMNSIQHPWFSA